LRFIVYFYKMENTVKKIQTETMYEVTFEGEKYQVVHTEDADPNSGCSSWDVYDDNGFLLEDAPFELMSTEEDYEDLENRIIAYVIENI